jgi:uncharacterized membrane protein YhaH (DUF805 family)
VRTLDIFLSFEGRLDRERWLGAAALLVTLVVAVYAMTWLLVRSDAIAARSSEAIRVFAQMALLAPWLPLDWKRFHDLDLAGGWAVLCPSLIVVGRTLEWPAIGERVPARDLVETSASWVQLGLAATLAYLLAYRRGTQGPNRYGADPKQAVDEPNR